MSLFAVCLTMLVYGSLCTAYSHTNVRAVPIII